MSDPIVMALAAEVERLTGEVERLRGICQRIRAGWLPHRLSNGSWWWGRPSGGDGFFLWATGFVPTMDVPEPMTKQEVTDWMATLHPMATETATLTDEGGE